MTMFDRLQKPFLTVETGEAYQPIRLTYNVRNHDQLISILKKLNCLEAQASPQNWIWYWRDECESIRFESLESFRKNPDKALRLGTVVLDGHTLYINIPSFKRACLGVPFFHRLINKDVALVHKADFINKVFALDERLPHGFTELFKEEELDHILHQRVEDYHKVKERCEMAATAEEAFAILSDYTRTEAHKALPYAERYVFEFLPDQDLEVLFLAFYIFLRGRELVAIKRWFGQSGYSLADVADETVEEVFGSLGIDIID